MKAKDELLLKIVEAFAEQGKFNDGTLGSLNSLKETMKTFMSIIDSLDKRIAILEKKKR